jgi:hypothetical protein
MPISTRQLLFVVALCATQALLVCNYALAVTFLTIDMAKLGATPFVTPPSSRLSSWESSCARSLELCSRLTLAATLC